MAKVLMLFPYAPAYREGIYRLMDEHLNVDWLFCSNAKRPLKFLNYSILNNCKLEISEHFFFNNFKFYRGIDFNLLDQYDVIITPGVIRNFSEWRIINRYRNGNKRTRVYLWTHGWYGKENILQRIVKKIFFNRASGLLLYGNYAKSLLLQQGIDGSKLYVIYNSLDYDKQLELRKYMSKNDVYKAHFGNKNPVLIMIGRLNLRKKLGMLIEAISRLASKGEQYNVVLIGDGEDRHSLEQMCVEHNLSNQVWFYGACYDEKENAELLFNSDLCVVPGDIGLTAIHSMMFGVPVISHNNFTTQGPEFEAIIEGRTGCLFQNGSVESLSDSISRWFSQNRVNREQIRQNCYNEIDSHWNPYFQLSVIKKIIYDGKDH